MTPEDEALLNNMIDHYSKEDDDVVLYPVRKRMRQLITQNEEMTETLKFVERWVNHHGAHPKTTAEEALAVIQHCDPIKKITLSYADGVVPPTKNPYTELHELRALVRKLYQCLDELNDMVMGECPSLLNEDSGGSVRLAMMIDDLLGLQE